MRISIPARQRHGDLGPKQLAWCREKISSFAQAHDAVQKMLADVAANRAEMIEDEKP